MLAWLLAVLVAARRRPSLVVQRGRGASPSQILIAQVGEAVMIAAPAAAAGGLVDSFVWAKPGPDDSRAPAKAAA